MEVPPDVILYPEFHLVVWKPQGMLKEKTVNRVIRFLAHEEARSEKAFNRFSDTTRLETVELNFRYVFHVAIYRRLTYSGRPSAKSAFLVDDRKAAHYFKLHALLTDHSSLRVRTFARRSAAARWLGLPIEFLSRT
ncbi:MAG: hypothetical protein ACJ8M1_12590 [Chthoniobacterales bacterium]